MARQTTRGPISQIGPERKRQVLRLLARGEAEIAAAKGYDLDKVLAEADRLLADARCEGSFTPTAARKD